MIVTRFQYPLDKNLIAKLDLMSKRCSQKNPKRDAVLLIEGSEGEGKTSASIAIAYYIAEKMGRTFTAQRVFSDVKKMIKFLQDNEDEIAIWDEPALQALSGDALTSVVKDMKRMLMMCRKKRHFIIINMTYFTEFGNYIVWQRPLGMIHVYSRNETEPGRFIYIRKKKLEYLWNDWRTKKKRNYLKYSLKMIRGRFPDILNPEYDHNVLSEFDNDYYEKQKDEAINSIGSPKEKLTRTDIKTMAIQYKISLLAKRFSINSLELARFLNVDHQTLGNWRHYPTKYPEILREIDLKKRNSKNYIINGSKDDDLDEDEARQGTRHELLPINDTESEEEGL